MRAPWSWLTTLASLPEGVGVRELARAYTDAGLQVERIESPAEAIDGPVVVGRVLDYVEEPQKNGKVIRWCHVDVGEHNPPGEPGRGIVCGAHNFDVGDYVAVALSGTTLPGGFLIAARKTYGHVSDGMICAEDELGIGSDHAGIIVLPADPPPAVGSDALAPLGMREHIYEIDVTPDSGHCLSLRGLAREAAQITGGTFADPYDAPVPADSGAGYPVRLESDDCPLFVALGVHGVDPHAPVPRWMADRVRAAGMRSISLPVDVANYVMLESGQPLHTYDTTTLRGEIVVRSARNGERLTTLDKQDRALSEDDLLITDDSGPIGLAGVMGGLDTEMTPTTTEILIEAAWFAPARIGRTYRRHKLPSEASRRFERGVDMGVPYAAARRAAELLRDYGGGVIDEAVTVAGAVRPMPSQVIRADLPGAILGLDVPGARVVEILRASGVRVEVVDARLRLTPPTWRRDLVDPYDYVEEVGRKLGFRHIVPKVPLAPAGRGYTTAQRARRTVLTAVAAAGFTEVQTLPFVAGDDLDRLGLDPDDPRRALVRLANPLSDAQPYLRPSLLPGLFGAVNRNTSRSLADLALFECGLVFRDTGAPGEIMPDVSRRPSPDEIATLFANLPAQPRHLAGVVTGEWCAAGWRGPAVPADWTHAVRLAQAAASALGVTLTRRAAAVAPWHPGRCAEVLIVDSAGVETSLGWAGELHPSVTAACGLPERTCAVELDLDALIAAAPAGRTIAPLSSHPAVKQDVALVVGADVPAADVRAALIAGAGDLLESVELFDVFTGVQLGGGKKSLAYALAFRSPERTLTEADATRARDAAVAEAARRCGAVMRS
ncbi:MAG: phenylalanine--tRNA ligase subunit beta [Actinomycetia bacterium]|nr:phenylalanine--tRNA ligase subunit beta [Actinomycetes bacterium]